MTPEEGIKFLLLFFFIGGSFWILRPLGRAVAKKIEGSGSASEELLGEMDALRHDVAQLSERLDFTERMLAKQQEQPRVGPGAR
jgi:hypothetical protein